MKKTLAISFFLLLVSSAYSQKHRADSSAVSKDSLSLKDLDNPFTYEDSLDIFDLIDSLLKLKTEKGPSQLAARIGYNSKAVITGDVTQVDLPFGKLSGLVEAEKVISGVEGISFVHFNDRDVVRHPLVQRIVRAYETYSNQIARQQTLRFAESGGAAPEPQE